MGDVSTVDTKEKSETTDVQVEWWRVDDLPTLKGLLPNITHDEWLHGYVTSMFRDPNTLILQSGSSCIVASIIDHPFLRKVCFIVWAQNPDHVPTKLGMSIVESWAEDRKCEALASLIGSTDKPMKKIRAYQRLTGLKCYRMVMLKEL